MAHRFSLLTIIAIVLLVLSGCAWFGKDKPEKPAQQLVQEGVKDYDRGHYKDALEAFQQLRDWYPFSKYAILAELRIADAHYHLEEYPEAVTAYEEFERLHPRNEAIPYVIYQIGLCHFEQIDSVDRDQTSARKAMETFQRLIRQHPDDPYAKKAGANLVACIQSLAGHEYYVGQYYYKRQYYKAALHRFWAVINQYPDVGYHKKALEYIAECQAYETVEPRVATATAGN
ncbi:MAG: outer membrane protein assembly factor BamD [Desulfobacterales bacterium]|nr:outer membrane protein assembly factor BamD [Desulfobacterales bacterium]